MNSYVLQLFKEGDIKKPIGVYFNVRLSPNDIFTNLPIMEANSIKITPNSNLSGATEVEDKPFYATSLEDIMSIHQHILLTKQDIFFANNRRNANKKICYY